VVPNGTDPPTANHGKQDLLEASLQDRVRQAVACFNRCLDAAIAAPTPANLDQLRQAADRLMRAGARVLIELERRKP
jgi:alpha-D-ribose 1-methylphosphonate 5-triphosphate synthase subunit PhnH